MAALTAGTFKTLLAEASPYQGVCYRCMQPRFANARDTLSGEGSDFAPGRYHIKGAFRIVYAACTFEQMEWEYFHTARNKDFSPADLLPVTMVAIDASLTAVLDLTQNETRTILGVTETDLLQPWQGPTEALTQKIGRRTYEAGFEGLLVPSEGGGQNLNVFPANLQPGSTFALRNTEKLVG